MDICLLWTKLFWIKMCSTTEELKIQIINVTKLKYNIPDANLYIHEFDWQKKSFCKETHAI